MGKSELGPSCQLLETAYLSSAMQESLYTSKCFFIQKGDALEVDFPLGALFQLTENIK